MSMPEVYDTIICGAGPSGSVAARTLAKNGFSVLLLDKDQFPRDKPCGGGLCPHIRQFDYLFEELPKILESTCRRGIIFSENGKYSADSGVMDAVFYNIRREKFDHKLLQLAQKEGAKFRQGTVTKIEIEEDGVTVTTGKGEEAETIRGRTVIGSMGAHDRLQKMIAKEHGFEDQIKKTMATILVKEFEIDEDFIIEKLGEEKTAIIQLKVAGMPGYGWIFTKKGILNIGYGSYNENMKKVDKKQVFQDFIDILKKRDMVPKDLVVTDFAAAPLPLGVGYPVTYTNRGLITGDAAGFVSPLSGEGIYYAMDSGLIAGAVLCEKLREDKLTAADLRIYQDRWYEAWGKDLEVLQAFQKWLMRFPNMAIKIVRKDKELLDLLIQLFMGSVSAKKEEGRIKKLVARGIFKF